jgi:hypothetical protein
MCRNSPTIQAIDYWEDDPGYSLFCWNNTEPLPCDGQFAITGNAGLTNLNKGSHSDFTYSGEASIYPQTPRWYGIRVKLDQGILSAQLISEYELIEDVTCSVAFFL